MIYISESLLDTGLRVLILKNGLFSNITNRSKLGVKPKILLNKPFLWVRLSPQSKRVFDNCYSLDQTTNSEFANFCNKSTNKIYINWHYNFIYLKLIFDPFKCVMGFNFTQVTIPGRFLFGHNRKPIAGIGWSTETVKGEKNRQKSCNCFWIGPGFRSGVKALSIKPMLIKVEWFT